MQQGSRISFSLQANIENEKPQANPKTSYGSGYVSSTCTISRGGGGTYLGTNRLGRGSAATLRPKPAPYAGGHMEYQRSLAPLTRAEPREICGRAKSACKFLS